jgi:hypothetical protein
MYAMKEILSVLLGFLPWIAFGIISGPSLFRLNAAIIAALVLVVATGLKQLARGFVLTWGSLVFFCIMLVVVVFLKNGWVIRNLDILAHLTLAVIAWFSIFIGKPFVLQYARETTPPERQNSPFFFPICRNLAALWGTIFLATTFMSVAKTAGWLSDGIGYQAMSFGLILLGLWLNHWYPKYASGKLKKGDV